MTRFLVALAVALIVAGFVAGIGYHDDGLSTLFGGAAWLTLAAALAVDAQRTRRTVRPGLPADRRARNAR